MSIFDRFRNKNDVSICINEFLNVYEPNSNLTKPDDKILVWGRKMLPKEIIQLWLEYGFGNYGNGIIKIIDPREYMESLYTWLNGEDFNKIPIAITAFGDMFFYERIKNTISFLDIHYRKTILCTDSYQEFFEKFIINDNIKLGVLKEKLFNQALDKLGNIEANEIYFFVPALCIGGQEDIKNLNKGDARIHHDILFQLGNQ